MKIKFLFFLLIFSHALFAQLPNTDIWLLDIKATKDTIIVSNPVNITNRTGYDNQPSFSPDGKYLLYTSIRDEKQSDIYKYDLKTKQITQFTNTPATSEYSPTFMPDEKNISVVMVEPDSTQRLWKFPLKGGPPKLVMGKVDSIGYHCWFMSSKVAVLTLTEPSSLMLISSNSPKFIDKGTGRCIREHNGMIFYTKKNVESKNKFYCFNLPGWHIQNDIPTVIESEDYAFLNDTVIFGDKQFLKKVEMYGIIVSVIADLTSYNIKNITRIAISPDGTKMAIVAE